jgi:amino acid transporter
MFYLDLFLIFLYFKIARVHKKEEKFTNSVIATHAIVALSAFALLAYGFNSNSWLYIFLVSFLFFIAAALMVTAVQVGIFIDGKPFIKLSSLHKSMPFIAAIVAILTVGIYSF